MADQEAEALRQLAEQFRPVLERSPDGVYLWLDENHMVCNAQLAKMFGYASPEELVQRTPFLDTFVFEEDRDFFSWHYHLGVEGFAYPATFRFRGVRKDGSVFAAETDMIPISWHGQPVAYHFVRQLTGRT